MVRSTNLPGSGALAQAVVNFWRTLPSSSYPQSQALASVEVLASDPAGAVTIVGDSGGAVGVDRPNYPTVRAALLNWAHRVKKEGGVGFLHWIGHGAEQLKGGNIVNLSCDGPRDDGLGQSGLDWTLTLHVINWITAGQPVYCFIDACRSPKRDDLLDEGIGAPNLATPENAYVFYSSARGQEAFWVVTPKQAAITAGCREHALGTRAFMEALKGFGARTDDPKATAAPIVAAELVQAAHALVTRWARHQQISPGPSCPEGPPGYKTRPILLTREPKSTVDVHAKGVPSPTSCDALCDTPPPVGSETASPIFEFRLARKPQATCPKMVQLCPVCPCAGAQWAGQRRGPFLRRAGRPVRKVPFAPRGQAGVGSRCPGHLCRRQSGKSRALDQGRGRSIGRRRPNAAETVEREREGSVCQRRPPVLLRGRVPQRQYDRARSERWKVLSGRSLSR
ncbi:MULTISPECIES: hypothetical protein [Bradyrhizobium]|uniref:hypothetical protein n=1 Tax=Bradyrhizobium TaxID=374 RepID=UPI0012FD48DA|nr:MULTISPECIES: hypothetical protein [Bradyrhizobium]